MKQAGPDLFQFGDHRLGFVDGVVDGVEDMGDSMALTTVRHIYHKVTHV